MSDDKISEERIASTAVAPRVTLGELETNIASVHYFTAAEGDEAHRIKNEPDDYKAMTPAPQSLKLLTLCVLVLQNGFTVIGKSACASPENFNPELGKDLAYANAKNQIWELMGYSLRERLHREKQLLEAAVVKPHEDMGTYVGTKVVNAKPMNRLQYNHLRGWQVPADENPLDEGYLVEYTDRADRNVDGYEGYISWSPKDVFERAYVMK